jgi:hypothetical protein
MNWLHMADEGDSFVEGEKFKSNEELELESSNNDVRVGYSSTLMLQFLVI